MDKVVRHPVIVRSQQPCRFAVPGRLGVLTLQHRDLREQVPQAGMMLEAVHVRIDQVACFIQLLGCNQRLRVGKHVLRTSGIDLAGAGKVINRCGIVRPPLVQDAEVVVTRRARLVQLDRVLEHALGGIEGVLLQQNAAHQNVPGRFVRIPIDRLDHERAGSLELTGLKCRLRLLMYELRVDQIHSVVGLLTILKTDLRGAAATVQACCKDRDRDDESLHH